MQRLMFNLAGIPDLSESTDPEATVHSHTPISSSDIVLADDNVLRVGGRIIWLYRSHRQSASDEHTSVGDTSTEFSGELCVNASVALALYRNPSFIPKMWLPDMALDSHDNRCGGGVIFRGTTATSSRSSCKCYVSLAVNAGEPVLMLMGLHNLVRYRATAMFAV